MDYRIVPMDGFHLDEVEAIEKTCFADPWSRKLLEEALTSEHSSALAAVEEGGAVLGYLFFSSVLDEGSVDNLAVRPEARRRGVASALLEAFRLHGRAHGLSALFLEVRPSNGGAVTLYQKSGYQEIGRRKNYYLNPKEDAIIMKQELLPCT